MSFSRLLSMFAAAVLLSGCAMTRPQMSSAANPAAGEINGSPWAILSSDRGLAEATRPEAPPAWQHRQLPGKQPTQFAYTRKDGRDAIAVLAVSSASMLRRHLRVEPDQLDRVRFSWLVPELIGQADMSQRDLDDSPVRIVLAFDGDRSKFSAKNAMLSELARSLTGEELPYATLMYVWCNRRPAESVIVNPRTDRIRKLVVESGPLHLNRWMDYERNIRADFERVFGEPPGALIGIGLLSDTDNTHSTARAWYGPLRLEPLRASAAATR